MNKLITLITALCLVLSLSACQTGGSSQTDPAEITTPTEPGFTFIYNGTEISMNAEAAPILDALGEAVSCTEQASCAFTGLDKTFYYGSFYMDTYPIDSKDYVYSVWLADDTVTTAEGLYIGATQTQVESIYGSDSFNGTNAYILSKGESKLTIILEEGLVTSIQYDAILS